MTALSGPPKARFPIVAALSALAALALDQATKIHCQTSFLAAQAAAASSRVPSSLLFALGVPPAQRHLDDAGARAASPCWFAVELTHVGNRGITFGMLETAAPAVPVAAFYATTLIGMVVSAVVLLNARRGDWLARVGAVLVLTGVVANLLDRLRIGYVVDWLVVAWRMSAWQVELPAFNFGDAYIVAGVTLVGAALIAHRLAPRESR